MVGGMGEGRLGPFNLDAKRLNVLAPGGRFCILSDVMRIASESDEKSDHQSSPEPPRDRTDPYILIPPAFDRPRLIVWPEV